MRKEDFHSVFRDKVDCDRFDTDVLSEIETK